MSKYSTRENEITFLMDSLAVRKKELVKQLIDVDERLADLGAEYEKCVKDESEGINVR
tara:strand:+ start:3374 stop:3547 length:174 start_codon:yes stop_codon:yes gene_type:complete